MIDEIIKKLLAYFPVTWPLQQAISINPLNDLNHKSIIEASAELIAKANIKATLSYSEYFQLINKQKISKPSILNALYYFAKKELKNIDHDVIALDSLVNSMFDFIVKQIEIYAANESVISKDNKSQLIAFKLNHYFYDEVSSLITAECLNALINHIHEPNDQSLLERWLSLTKFKSKAWLQRDLTIESLLTELNIKQQHWQTYLFQLMWQLKGWVGYIKWQLNNKENPWRTTQIELNDVIIIWLLQELYWLKHKKPAQPLPICFEFTSPATTALNDEQETYVSATLENLPDLIDSTRLSWLLQHALEIEYQSTLTSQLILSRSRSILSPTKSKAQWVFCIDVRSEPCRRLLEKQGHYETFGFAGFFNFPFCLVHQDKLSLQCPALIAPTLIVNFFLDTNFFEQLNNTLAFSIKKSKLGLFSAFMMVEMLGICYALILFFKNFAKSSKSTLALSKKQLDEFDQVINSNQEILYQQAKTFLDIICFKQYANVILLCAHGASSTNNPFHSSLDCGACGGNNGIYNAIFACQVLNNQQIRKQLQHDGFELPTTTYFIPALHNTTMNTIQILDKTILFSKDLTQQLAAINQDLRDIEPILQAEKASALPGNKNLIWRAHDWSEPLPELGLANNAAMIIGPRSATKSINLNARVFLHEYEHHYDKQGDILETIMTAPMIVAHWINMQYYFSSIDPDNYGSGNKVLHNVLPKIGVMQGNLSDLKIGLSQQSLFFQNQRLHQTLRLSVIVFCSFTKIMAVIEKHNALKTLIKGEWLWLNIITDDDEIININQHME